jgi:voltage-gated potassium channel
MIWALFALEYGIRLYLAPRKGAFMRHNVIDLAIVILPFLRPLRVVRSARALRLLRAGRGATFLFRGLESGRDVLTRHKLHYALLTTMAFVLGGALIVTELERGVTGSHINSLQDGLWWAISTVTTVGYGDAVPLTAAGRGVAVLLMISGVGVFGLLAASLSSFFIERRQEDTIELRLAEIAERLERIEGAIDGASTPVAGTEPGDSGAFIE